MCLRSGADERGDYDKVGYNKNSDHIDIIVLYAQGIWLQTKGRQLIGGG